MMLTVLAVMFAMPMGAQTPATAATCKVTGTVMDKETGEPEMMATVCVAHKSLPGTGVKRCWPIALVDLRWWCPSCQANTPSPQPWWAEWQSPVASL